MLEQPRHSLGVSPPTPGFPRHNLQGASKAHVPSPPERTNSYTILRQDSALIFPEPNAMRMDLRVQRRLRVNRPLRFIVQSGHWTGTGVQGYPWIHANYAGSRLNARVHGRPFWDGNHKAFQIDLGVELPQGATFDIVTQTLYVDEVSHFEPYLTHSAPEQMEKLDLTVAFIRAPQRAVFYFRPISAVEPNEPIETTSSSRFGLTAFTYRVEDPPPGDYCLSWTKEMLS